MQDSEPETVNWAVHFRQEGQWEWLSAEARHPAGAKQEIHAQLGESIEEWGFVTRTDGRKTLKRLQKEKVGRKLAEDPISAILESTR